MTVVENINWSELLKHPIVTAQHANGKNRIAAATDTLQQTAHQFVEVLNERARLLADSAQFDTALHDAAAIRALLPGSGLGYLCTGDVYCQQGHYAAAISIYDRGLAAVPESDPYYQQLQQQREKAVISNDKRIDFISQLPSDIVTTNILPRIRRIFSSESPCDYLYVSRAWQERILQQPNGLNFGFDQETMTLKWGHDQLIRFAPYVQKLTGYVFDDVNLEDLFSRARFSNLKELYIKCNASTPHEPLINGLEMIAASLTHLDIMGGHSIRLCDIMESCPNLVSLAAAEVDVVLPSWFSPSTRYPKMKHLAIHTVPDPTYDTMVDVLSLLPFLLSFEIMPMPESSVLTILHEYCPYLQRIYFDEGSFPYDRMDAHRPDRKGIQRAYLYGIHDAYIQDHLIQFLLTHRHSLETFEFDGDILQDDNALWKLSNGRLLADPTQSVTSLIRLNDIRFSNLCSSECEPFIEWIIANAPNLRVIRLTEPLLKPAIANAMTIQSKHLSKLEIARSSPVDDCEGIIQFLDYHIAMGDHSALKEIILRADMGLPSVTWLRRLPLLKCLKNLEILSKFIYQDCSTVLAECSSLEKLTLGMKGATFDPDLIKPLHVLPNLKCLRLAARSLPNCELIALTTFPSLEQLYLSCDVPDFIMEKLLNRIPKLIINRQQYEKRVSDSTTQLQHAIQNVLHALNDRAIALTLSANFAAALRDANAMQEISPLSPLGYLREATIYSEQGRQQAAIDICNEAISVVDISDPGYRKLEEVKMVAMQRDTCLIDFISQLPLEIVTDVLFPMFMDDDGMLDGKKRCGGGLHFKIDNRYPYGEVVRRAQYTKPIQVASYHQGNWLSDLFRRANLCYLRELKIKELKDDTDVDDLVLSLKAVSTTLTHLTIWETTRVQFMPILKRRLGRPTPPPPPPVPVVDILINCPNSVTLDVDYRFNTVFSSVPLTKTWPQLTTLRLNYYSGVTFDGQFLEILKRFPSLKKLVLNPCIEPQPMTIIQRYCPSMRDLQLTTRRRRSS